MTKRYYDKKMKDFFELKIGSMTIHEYERRFLELLNYVSFIKEEPIKIQMHLSELPSFIGDKIQYDDPKTLEETIRRAKCIYDQHKGRPTFQNLGNIRRKTIWNRGRRGLSHHSLEIILRDNQPIENPE
jgi:hypothetical protein